MFRAQTRLATQLLFALVTVLPAAASDIVLDRPDLYLLQSKSFVLDTSLEADIECQAIRKKFGNESYNGAWLVSLIDGREVWRSNPMKGQPIDGSRVMYRQQETVRLTAGSYRLYQYGGGTWHTSDPFGEWRNVMNDLADMLNRERPDKDTGEFVEQCFVRMSLPGRVVETDVEKPPVPDGAFISMMEIGDDARELRMFRLDREIVVRVICAGEYSQRGKRFYDLGWIEEALTGEPVWQMTLDESKPAGGTPRNHLINRTVRLGAGVYTAGYISDESHAVGSWNAMPPSRPELWGLTITTADPGSVHIVDVETYENPEVLASMLRVGDDERRETDFDLREARTVHIHALGEGRSSGMYDYGRIEDLDSNRVVWKMTYKDCRHGGGTNRNLRFSGDVELPAGRYRAIYLTDDSHSFERWNSPPPDEQFRYGMVITLR